MNVSGKILLTIYFSLIFLTPSYALVFGGSNLGYMGYPEHSCSKPFKPFEFYDEYQIDRYRTEVESYISCINDYVDNANNDIKRIQEAAEEAIDEANAPY